MGLLSWLAGSPNETSYPDRNRREEATNASSIPPADRPAGGALRPLEPDPAAPQKVPYPEPRTLDAGAPTQVLATLEDPWQRGRNAVWCCTAQRVWREFGRGVLGGRVHVYDPPPLVKRLNEAAPVPLPSGCSWLRTGKRTRAELAAAVADLGREFPDALAMLPRISENPLGYFAIAYLEVGFKFRTAFAPFEAPVGFAGSDGTEMGVEMFGFPQAKAGSMRDARRQVAVLYDAGRDDQPEAGASLFTSDDALQREFIFDLDRTSDAAQLVIARVNRRETLAATWAHALECMERGRVRPLGKTDTLAVPRMDWSIRHAWSELTGLRLANSGFDGQSIDDLHQCTRFRLDHTGVDMASLATFLTRGGSFSDYSVRSPYLIALRRRGSEQPFFLAYVANTKLLIAPE